MTMAQVVYFSEVAAIREHNEFSDRAALQGHKVKRKSYDTLRIHSLMNNKENAAKVDHDQITKDVATILQDKKNGI